MSDTVVPAVREHHAQLMIEPRVEQIRTASAWLHQTGHVFGAPEDQIGRLDLCLNEALANVLDHGTDAARAAPIALDLSVCFRDESGEATLKLSDSGAAFDPLAHRPRPPANSLDEVEPGGLGLVMILHHSNTQAYARESGRNHFSFGVRWGIAT